MKIIRIINPDSPLMLDIHPDSAMLLPGRPLFLPDWGDGWSVCGHLAVRIGRLGKNVAVKFASRYYDAVTVALRVTVPGCDEAMQGVLSGMDGTIAHGEWLEPSVAAAPVEILVGDVSLILPPQAEAIAEAVHQVSRYMTLKMGDVIFLPLSTEPVVLTAGKHLAVDLDGRQVMDLKIV